MLDNEQGMHHDLAIWDRGLIQHFQPCQWGGTSESAKGGGAKISQTPSEYMFLSMDSQSWCILAPFSSLPNEIQNVIEQPLGGIAPSDLHGVSYEREWVIKDSWVAFVVE